MGWLEAIHPEDRAEMTARWFAAREAHVLFETEGRLWHAPSGEYHKAIACYNDGDFGCAKLTIEPVLRREPDCAGPEFDHRILGNAVTHPDRRIHPRSVMRPSRPETRDQGPGPRRA